MATTIQIKRGTGSAVPTGLADGELAINLDNGKLFFGSGSTSINSFTFENLTAENYIVSSSVTNITTQTLSGSTAFGNSTDDTHQFTGAITASNNISASGNITGQDLLSSRDIISSRYISALGYISSSASLIGNEIDVRGHVTASGNISSSGTITGNSIVGTLGTAAQTNITSLGTLTALTVDNLSLNSNAISSTGDTDVFVTLGTNGIGFEANSGDKFTFNGNQNNVDLQVAGENDVNLIYLDASTDNVGIGDATPTAKLDVAGNINSTSHITASGNISSSGNLIAVSMSAAAFSGDGSGITNVTAVAADGTYSSSLQILSNITASGNISASGTIIAATLDAAAVSDTLAAAIVAEIDNDEIPIAKLAEDSISGVALGSNLNNLTVDNATLQLNSGTTYNGSAARTISIKDGGVDSDALADDITVAGDLTVADNIIHSGDTDTKIRFVTDAVRVDAGGTAVFNSSTTGSVLPMVHQNVFDTGSLALTANSAFGDIVKFGGSSTVAGGIYQLQPDGTWGLALADATTTSTGSLAVAVGTNSTTDGMCLRGFMNPFLDPGAGIGSPVYLSDTATGRLLAVPPSSTGDVVRIVGYQYGTDLVYFNPSNDFIVHA